MIFANRTTALRAAEMPESGAETLNCPKQRTHSVRMEWEHRNGVRTGRMVAWCYDCGCTIPNEPAAVTISDAERTEPPRPRSRAHDTPATETDDTRRRNAAIRLEWARERTPHTKLAERYGLSAQRIAVIIHGKLPRRRFA